MSRIALMSAAVAAALPGPASATQVDLSTACQGFGALSGEVITLGSGAPANLCWFEENRGCTLDALQSGACGNGGRRTTGYLTQAGRYCAWLGGEVAVAESGEPGLDEIDGICTLPDGRTCVVGRLYYGTCE
jgi:hypothetical protein